MWRLTPPQSCRHSHPQGDPVASDRPTHGDHTGAPGCLGQTAAHTWETDPPQEPGSHRCLRPWRRVCRSLRGLGATLAPTHCTPAHTPPGAPTCGVGEPHLPSHDLQGQEVVLLVQTPVVEEQPAGLHCGKPGWGGQGESQAALLAPTTLRQGGWREGAQAGVGEGARQSDRPGRAAGRGGRNRRRGQ